MRILDVILKVSWKHFDLFAYEDKSMIKALFKGLFAWCTRQDLNLRPSESESHAYRYHMHNKGLFYLYLMHIMHDMHIRWHTYWHTDFKYGKPVKKSVKWINFSQKFHKGFSFGSGDWI